MNPDQNRQLGAGGDASRAGDVEVETLELVLWLVGNLKVLGDAQQMAHVDGHLRAARAGQKQTSADRSPAERSPADRFPADINTPIARCVDDSPAKRVDRLCKLKTPGDARKLDAPELMHRHGRIVSHKTLKGRVETGMLDSRGRHCVWERCYEREK